MAEQTIGYSDIGIAGAEAANRECDLVMTGSGSAGCVLASRLGEDKIASALVLETGEHDRNKLFHRPACLAGMTKGIAGRGGRPSIGSTLRIVNFGTRRATLEAMHRTRMHRRTRTDADAARTASRGTARFVANSLLTWNASGKSESPRSKSSRRTQTPAVIPHPSAQLRPRAINPTVF